MTPFQQLRILVFVLGALNALDIITTYYGLRHPQAFAEANGIVRRVLAWAGGTVPGLLLVKLPLVLYMLVAALPQQAGAVGVPVSVLVWVAETPTWSWIAQIVFYAAIVGHNAFLIWRHEK